MTETDLQVGGGYTYQWECAILLALNTFFEPVRYNPTLFDLIDTFLKRVDQIHLEGEDRKSGIDLEDINLITDDRRILIQVKTKQAEGERWTLSDPLLLKALQKFYDSRFLTDQPEGTRFVFLTNRPFNPDLVEVKAAIGKGDVAACAAGDRLGTYLDRYAHRTSEGPLDVKRFRATLARTRFVEYLGVDEVKANIQAKLQALGRDDWEAAHAVLFEHFARQSTRVGGANVTRASVIELLGPAPKPSAPYRIDTGGGAYIGGNIIVQGGDFVGRDKVEGGPRPATPPARPSVPSEGEPLALLAAALDARRFLLIWAATPFPPEEHASVPPALLINRWREAAPGLPGTPFDFAHGRPWPLAALPPLTILSLDPSDRLERAFRYAGTPLQVVCTQAELPARERHNLIKLGGDLGSRTGLLLDWDAVRKASSDPHKAHLLRGAGRVAQEGAVLVVTASPDEAFARTWHELVAPAVRGAKHHFALGPPRFAWPEPLTRLDGAVDAVFSALADKVIPSPLEPAERQSFHTPTTETGQEPAANGGVNNGPSRESPDPGAPTALAASESLVHRAEMAAIHHKLDRLSQGQEELLDGQTAISRQMDASQRETVARVLAGLQEARLDDARVQRELRGTLDAVHRALLHLQTQQLPDLADELKQTLDEVTEILRAGVDVRTGLELTIPLIPLLLSYRATLEAGAGLDLRQAWEDLIDWAGR